MWKICKQHEDSTESDASYGDFMAKLIWRLSGNLIYHIYPIRIPDNLHTNFTIKSQKVSLSTLPPYNLHTNHPDNQIYHVFSKRNLDKFLNFSILWRKLNFSSESSVKNNNFIDGRYIMAQMVMCKIHSNEKHSLLEKLL